MLLKWDTMFIFHSYKISAKIEKKKSAIIDVEYDRCLFSFQLEIIFIYLILLKGIFINKNSFFFFFWQSIILLNYQFTENLTNVFLYTQNLFYFSTFSKYSIMKSWIYNRYYYWYEVVWITFESNWKWLFFLFFYR